MVAGQGFGGGQDMGRTGPWARRPRGVGGNATPSFARYPAAAFGLHVRPSEQGLLAFPRRGSGLGGRGRSKEGRGAAFKRLP